MGASQSTTKVPPESDVDYFFETAYVWQGEQGGTHERHSSNSCPPTTSSANTASQPKQTLVGLQEQLTSQSQTTREVQRPRESQTMMERQTVRVGQPTTVTPSDAEGKTSPVELPLYREMTGVCDHFYTLTYNKLLELNKTIFPSRPREEHYQAACFIDKNAYDKLSCRYCGIKLGSSLKALVKHAFNKKHVFNVYVTCRWVPQKDFEFWRDIVIRAEQLRLDSLEVVEKAKVNDEQNLKTTVAASCPVPEPESEPNTPTVPVPESEANTPTVPVPESEPNTPTVPVPESEPNTPTVPVPESEPNTPTVPVPEPGPNTATHSPVSDLTVSTQKANTDFFYSDAKGYMHGAFQEEQMQEWYRKGYFDSKILIGIGQKEQLVPFSTLLAENGSSTPFAYKKKKTSMAESYAVLTHRPWYLIPMLHPIAVPSQMLVTDEKLVDEVEKLREKFSSRNKDSLDEVLSHLLTRSINCELCSTVLFDSRSEFVAHILSRQHHEELWENRSGVTKHDIDYWNYVLDLARPSEGPNEEHARILLNGRLRDEGGRLLYGENVANEAQTVPTEGPKDFIQKPTSAVQPVQTWSSGNAKNIVTKDNILNNSPPQKLSRSAKKANKKAKLYLQYRQHPQVPTTAPFFKLTITWPGLTREAAISARKTLRGLFFRLSLEQKVEATMALLPRTLTGDFVGCPICEVALHLGQPFIGHVLGQKHIEKLYTKNGAITQGDVDFYTKIIQECIK